MVTLGYMKNIHNVAIIALSGHGMFTMADCLRKKTGRLKADWTSTSIAWLASVERLAPTNKESVDAWSMFVHKQDMQRLGPRRFFPGGLAR